MNRYLAIPSLVLIGLLGCHRNPPPTVTIILFDISKSIYDSEVDREFSEMQKLLSQMRRDDELVLIPIMGNARNDTPGHILHLTAPTSRMPFDTDLVSFRRDANMQVKAMSAWAQQNRSQHTDIKGSLQIARQTIEQQHDIQSHLIVMSDFIEDDRQWNFTSDKSVDSVSHATTFAKTTRSQSAPATADTHLIRLRSKDAAALPPLRRASIDAFWQELLDQSGARAEFQSTR